MLSNQYVYTLIIFYKGEISDVQTYIKEEDAMDVLQDIESEGKKYAHVFKSKVKYYYSGKNASEHTFMREKCALDDDLSRDFLDNNFDDRDNYCLKDWQKEEIMNEWLHIAVYP